MTHKISLEPILRDTLEAEMNDPSCGAVVSFTGKVRNEQDGKTVVALDYEAYIPMAERVFYDIANEACTRFGVRAVRIVHRVGSLKIGDIAVWVGVQSGHRAEAFLACRYAIDEIKKKAPIWKKEHYDCGDSAWVACHHHGE